MSYEDKHIQNYLIDLAYHMADYIDECDRRLTRLEIRYGIKYDPNQPRHPAGTSEGGRWSGPLPQRKPSRGQITRPKIKPRVALPHRKPWREVAVHPLAHKPARIQHPHADSPYYDPESGIYDPPIEPVYPVEDVIGFLSGGVATALTVRGVTAARHALRLRGYLKQARQIPKGVKEVGKGIDRLNTSQTKKLKKFSRERSKTLDEVEVINYSDGSAVLSVRQTAKNIPKSFAIWEAKIHASGKRLQYYKLTIDPNGKLVHVHRYPIKK